MRRAAQVVCGSDDGYPPAVRKVSLGVVCDFDGTATLLDIGDEISKHFGGTAHWEAEHARFRKGELDTRGIIEAIYTKVFASEAEVCDFAAWAARLRPGFDDLVRACKDRDAPFILASGGLRQYVETVLDRHLSADLRSHVRVMANEGLFGSQGLKVHFPGRSRATELGCDVCGSCKRVAVAELRALGAGHVVGIGDGFADRCLARTADSLWAREGSYLHRFCIENGIPHTPFTTLVPVAHAVATFEA